MSTIVREKLDTIGKARELNLEPTVFGTFAEIGAAQEVVGCFFRAGHASATVAKVISAYDMAVSDELYGPTKRYVNRDRLTAMLNHEYESLLQRLGDSRGDRSKFFVFADTVATHTPSLDGKGHGWMGIRFQANMREEPSQILIHARLMDPVTLREQESLGIMGVNLIYGAVNYHGEPERLIGSLMDGLSRVRIEVDMIGFSGPAFRGVDNRLMSLQLVEQQLTDAAMFTSPGDAVDPADALHQKAIIIERGKFEPPIPEAALEMVHLGREKMRQHGEDDPLVLMEMTLNNLLSQEKIDHADFLDRADTLGALGHPVLITNFTTFHRVTTYLRTYTDRPIAMVMGAPTLKEVLDEKYYEELQGGILEAMGRLFHGPVTVFVYPLTEDGNTIPSAKDVPIAPHLGDLYSYLLENGFVQDL